MVVSYLGRVNFDLDVPLFCPTDQSILPNFNLPKQNRANSGMSKIKVNPTQDTDHQPHPVYSLTIHIDSLNKYISSYKISPFSFCSPLRPDLAPWPRGEWQEDEFTIRTGLIGRKLGLCPIWLKSGKKIITTMVQIEDNHVIRYDPPEKAAAESMVLAKKAVPYVMDRYE